MIEDTSFVIDLLRGDERAFERLELIEGERLPQKLSSITVLELYEGITRSIRPDDERTKVLEVLDSKHIVPADHELMRKAGAISGELYREGRPIDREDCIVAATARQEEEAVVTRNPDHLERVSGIEVVTY